MRIGLRKHDDQKLKELILLIASQSQEDATFGAVKLNKLLFYSDFLAHLSLGRSITGHDYFALQQGPCPKRLVPIVDEMQRDGELAVYEMKFHGYTQRKTVALREADLDKFRPEEVDLIYRVIKHYWGKTGKQMSDATHRFVGWVVANEKEVIPYSVALVGTREPTLDEIHRGMALEKMAVECLASRDR